MFSSLFFMGFKHLFINNYRMQTCHFIPIITIVRFILEGGLGHDYFLLFSYAPTTIYLAFKNQQISNQRTQ